MDLSQNRPSGQPSADLTDRTFVVTGSNTGIGRLTAEKLARRGGKVVLACRSAEKTKPVLDAIHAAGGAAEFLQLDLGDLASVRTAAKQLLARGDRIDVLVNNAGLAGSRGVTKDGFEITFGTNHLGPFLFTTLLLPRLRECTPARIVNVSSRAHYRPKRIDFGALRSSTKSATGLDEYGVSKLCNVLFTKELARGRAGKGVTSYALHPGVIASDIWRSVPWIVRPIVKLFMKSTEEGAETSLYCATSPEVADHDGRYYDECREKRPSRLADDEALARELWERSEEWTR
jgi:NAD(P)-dependent dehydrogenase (short-subunit alcohol dehydrogenase family)